jgi:hypothetical protein
LQGSQIFGKDEWLHRFCAKLILVIQDLQVLEGGESGFTDRDQNIVGSILIQPAYIQVKAN